MRARKPAGRDNHLYVHDVFLEETIKNQDSVANKGVHPIDAGLLRGPDLYKVILQDVYAFDQSSVSKIVDENGEPLVVYHVTDADLNTFDLSKARQSSDIPAFFFSSGTEDWAAKPRDSVTFIKRFDRNRSVTVNLSNDEKTGRIIVHKTFSETKDKPHVSKDGVRFIRSEGGRSSISRNGKPLPGGLLSTLDDAIVAGDLFRENPSRVVDENGEPLVVYHVTDADFNTFDLSRARQSSDIPAFFFSSGLTRTTRGTTRTLTDLRRAYRCHGNKVHHTPAKERAPSGKAVIR